MEPQDNNDNDNQISDKKIIRINPYKSEYSEGSIDFYKNMFPLLFDDDEDYTAFVDYYNSNESEHLINLKSIDSVKSIFRETKLTNK